MFVIQLTKVCHRVHGKKNGHDVTVSLPRQLGIGGGHRALNNTLNRAVFDLIIERPNVILFHFGVLGHLEHSTVLRTEGDE